MMTLRKVIFSGIFIVFGLLFTAQSQSAELLILEQKACPWCAKWHEEIGVVYHKTQEGKRAPLRVVDIHEPWPDDLSEIAREPFTPTFVLVENGIEVDRMRGYTAEESFWFLLGEMLEKLDPVSTSQNAN